MAAGDRQDGSPRLKIQFLCLDYHMFGATGHCMRCPMTEDEFTTRRYKMGKSDEKNFGPHIVGMMLGTCIGSYIEYGVTRKELVRLVKDQYDGIVATLKQQGIHPGFGKLSDENLCKTAGKLREQLLAEPSIGPDRKAAFVGTLDELVKLIVEKM